MQRRGGMAAPYGVSLSVGLRAFPIGTVAESLAPQAHWRWSCTTADDLTTISTPACEQILEAICDRRRATCRTMRRCRHWRRHCDFRATRPKAEVAALSSGLTSIAPAVKTCESRESAIVRRSNTRSHECMCRKMCISELGFLLVRVSQGVSHPNPVTLSP